MIEAGGLASFALHLLDERDELLERHALGDEGVDDRIGVGVAERHAAHHHLLGRNAEAFLQYLMSRAQRRLRTRIEPKRTRRHHDRLQEQHLAETAEMHGRTGWKRIWNGVERIVVTAVVTSQRSLATIAGPTHVGCGGSLRPRLEMPMLKMASDERCGFDSPTGRQLIVIIQ
jgi:hypothetical protein